MTQQTIANREEAIARVEAAANETWKFVALACIHACAKEMLEFTADDVWDRINETGADAHEPSALGPRMRVAASKGWVAKMPGVLKPVSKYSQRHRELQVWRSLIRTE